MRVRRVSVRDLQLDFHQLEREMLSVIIQCCLPLMESVVEITHKASSRMPLLPEVLCEQLDG